VKNGVRVGGRRGVREGGRKVITGGQPGIVKIHLVREGGGGGQGGKGKKIAVCQKENGCTKKRIRGRGEKALNRKSLEWGVQNTGMTGSEGGKGVVLPFKRQGRTSTKTQGTKV